MKTFLAQLGSIMPGVSFALEANVGAGLQPIEDIPERNVPDKLTVVARWLDKHGRDCLARMDASRPAILTNPKLFAQEYARSFLPAVKATT